MQTRVRRTRPETVQDTLWDRTGTLARAAMSCTTQGPRSPFDWAVARYTYESTMQRRKQQHHAVRAWSVLESRQHQQHTQIMCRAQPSKPALTHSALHGELAVRALTAVLEGCVEPLADLTPLSSLLAQTRATAPGEGLVKRVVMVLPTHAPASRRTTPHMAGRTCFANDGGASRPQAAPENGA